MSISVRSSRLIDPPYALLPGSGTCDGGGCRRAVIPTPFTELVGIEHPVVSAGMGGGASNGDLAGRVSEAGGLGLIGASFVAPQDIRAMVSRAREITTNPIGI